jgi:hypothetical protein
MRIAFTFTASSSGSPVFVTGAGWAATGPRSESMVIKLINKLRKAFFMHGDSLDSYLNKSENVALTFCMVWLLVRAVAGGASNGCLQNQTTAPASI